MKVIFLSKFNKDIRKLNDTLIKNMLIEVIESLENANQISDIKNCKKLAGHKTAYRIRIGNYRLGFFYENGEIELTRFAKRNDIYKLFPILLSF